MHIYNGQIEYVIHIKTFNSINKFILYTHNLRATQSTHYFF